MEAPATPTSFDVVIVGAGLAGLVTANEALDRGLSVLVVEKQACPGGSTAMSGGWFAFSETAAQRRAGISDEREVFLEDMRVTGEGKADDALLGALLREDAASYEWLQQYVGEPSVVKLSAGQSRARSHRFDIDRVLDRLAERFARLGGTLALQTRAVRLQRRSGDRVDRVLLEHDGVERPVDAGRAVVLASGGFSRSRDLLEIFAPEQLAGIPHGGLGNTGDGLRMAWGLGAGFRDMGYVSGTFGSHPDTGDDAHELLTAFYMGAIIVNVDGERFVDESQPYKTLGAVCLRQPSGLGFEIFDQRVRARSEPGVPLSDIDAIEQLGHLLRADSLEALARAAGIDPRGLIRTVEEYNEVVLEGAADRWGRTGLCNGVGDLVPILEPPFYAYPAKTLMTTTFGGLTIDGSARVLDVFGAPIAGLYAAGEITGGFHGAAYLTGTALSKALTFGRVAARSLTEGRS